VTETVLMSAHAQLTEVQRTAVNWQEGALMVLAGPGSGKTQVLTCRIARLLTQSAGQHFRVLGLTFTNKAADEMRIRVASLAPGLEERALIATFHSFCGNILRQHGVHIGVRPDFAIYSADVDRRAILEDAVARAIEMGSDVLTMDAVKYLTVIDRLKARLVEPDDAVNEVRNLEALPTIIAAYRAYEDELRRINALDVNSLMFEAYRLIRQYPMVAARYRRSYPYWLVDEFQDTNKAQYELVRSLAGSDFKNVVAVADDDQIIYEWNGASYRQIQKFLADFGAAVIQLPTNYRCPPSIVAAANRLVAYNEKRTAQKAPLLSGKTTSKVPHREHIRLLVFRTDAAEAAGVAEEIAASDEGTRSSTAVLARTRTLLDGVYRALSTRGVRGVIAQRRDDFVSPEFRWLVAVMQQMARPLDRRNVRVLVESFNRMVGQSLPWQEVTAHAEASGTGYLDTWIHAIESAHLGASEKKLLSLVGGFMSDPGAFWAALETIVAEFRARDMAADEVDLQEDLAAWDELRRDIISHIGRAAPLQEVLQELQLRSKAPTQASDAVTLMTIHAAKGREFDSVYVIGLAEDVMPSFQSRQKGSSSPEMEEERRNCFVAITRTKEQLVLSRAENYRGWPKSPSRFLVEMGLVET
jgi:DNA helicase II / ATP-dependent DNA helicase PcrA